MPEVHDPKVPFRRDLEKVFKDKQTLRAFEKLFRVIPFDIDVRFNAIEGRQLNSIEPQIAMLFGLSQVNEEELAALAALIATNIADIATNAADIATNASDIATNAAAIAAIVEPSYTSIDSGDSPYAASDGEYVLCDMDGDIDVTPPATGRCWISRDGASNTLTIDATVNGTANPTINYDGSTAGVVKIGSVYRYF